MKHKWYEILLAVFLLLVVTDVLVTTKYVYVLSGTPRSSVPSGQFYSSSSTVKSSSSSATTTTYRTTTTWRTTTTTKTTTTKTTTSTTKTTTTTTTTLFCTGLPDGTACGDKTGCKVCKAGQCVKNTNKIYCGAADESFPSFRCKACDSEGACQLDIGADCSKGGGAYGPFCATCDATGACVSHDGDSCSVTGGSDPIDEGCGLCNDRECLPVDGAYCGSGDQFEKKCKKCNYGSCENNDYADCSLDGSFCGECKDGSCVTKYEGISCGGGGVLDTENPDWICGECKGRQCIATAERYACGPDGDAEDCKWCQNKKCVNVPNEEKQICGNDDGCQVCQGGNCVTKPWGSYCEGKGTQICEFCQQGACVNSITCKPCQECIEGILGIAQCVNCLICNKCDMSVIDLETKQQGVCVPKDCVPPAYKCSKCESTEKKSQGECVYQCNTDCQLCDQYNTCRDDCDGTMESCYCSTYFGVCMDCDTTQTCKVGGKGYYFCSEQTIT